MKQFTLLILVLFSINFSFSQDYSKLWTEVKANEINGLPKSAMKTLETIAKKAQKDNNETQIIKCLIYKSKFMLFLEDEAIYNIVTLFKTEISKSKAPYNHILQNYLANMYWQFYKKKRWQISRRSAITDNNSTDFRLWDAQTFYLNINTLLQASLSNSSLLQNSNLNEYHHLLIEEKGSKNLRPTLFDLLSHNAIEFYTKSALKLNSPSFMFQVNDPIFFADSRSFSQFKIQTNDSLSPELKTLEIFQKLERFHGNVKQLEALTDVHLKRLNFVLNSSSLPEKHKLYQSVLTAKYDENDESKIAYGYILAKSLYNEGNTYNYKSKPEVQWKIKEALKICNHIISKFPENRYSPFAENLKELILNPYLKIDYEKIIPTQKNSKILIHYKNASNLQFDLYEITQHQFDNFQDLYNDDLKLKKINKLKLSTTWTENLKDLNDFQTHSTEIKLPPLKNKRYILKITPTQLDNPPLTFAIFQVSDLVITKKTDKDFTYINVNNRTNGAPIPNVKLNFKYNKNYRNASRFQSHITDENGVLKLSRNSNEYSNLEITAITDQDQVTISNYYISKSYDYGTEKTDSKSFLFTDRSIYRPGQTIYFKGLLLEQEKGKSTPISNQDVYVTLYDTNDEEIEELEFTTNDYGSFNGNFVIPNHGLNGEYFIELYSDAGIIDDSFDILVEEYKRPKFEANFKPIEGLYRVNDSVQVTGEALSFSDSPISNAKVKYHIVREANYSIYRYGWDTNFTSQEIRSGETTTDASGIFNINFKAIPDATLNKQNLPLFTYSIKADITDINGETHSTSTKVKVGYHSLTASINAPLIYKKKNKENTVSISTNNLNGTHVNTKGQLKIYRLKAPKQILRPRPWESPEFQNFSLSEFRATFPNETYTNENDKKYWPKDYMVYQSNFDTGQSTSYPIKTKKWTSGTYLIEAIATDSFNNQIETQKIVQVYSDNDARIIDNTLFKIESDKSIYAPGETAKIVLGSAMKNLTIMVDIEKNKLIETSKFIVLNNNKNTLEIPIKASDRGGFIVHYYYVAHNNFYKGNIRINVPFSSSQLSIETLSFRDKLEPGKQETWSFKVKGPNGEKVNAQLLASMYDESLDQFSPHNWRFNPILKPNYTSHVQIAGHQSFGKNSEYLNTHIYLSPNNWKYDKLNWFGLNIQNSRAARRSYLRSIRVNTANFRSYYSSNVKPNFINGTVTSRSDGLPLPGVNIIIKGTSQGVQTDFDGNFEIEVEKGQTLVCSFVSMISASIKIGSDNVYEIELEEDSNNLDEVVVTAYHSKRKSSILGSVSKKKTEVINSQEIASFDQILQGQTSGLQVISGSGQPGSSSKVRIRGTHSLNGNQIPMYIIDGVPITEAEFQQLNPNEFSAISVLKDASATAIYGSRAANGVVVITTKKAEEQLKTMQARKNLNETAFFFPSLYTNEKGEISFSFDSPEALTSWKFQLLAHTKSFESAVINKTTITQKELMVVPNMPRFLRQGDDIVISSKIVNLSKNNLNGNIILHLTDPITGKEVNAEFQNTSATVPFAVSKNQNTEVSWKIKIPKSTSAIQIKIMASTGEYSDGEQHVLPILTNQTLVTETLPLWVNSKQTKEFVLEKLKNTTSTSLSHHNLTLEITSNPAWYAIQSLPYLMEYPYDCNEQTFSKLYANSLASHIANSSPKIKAVFEQWKSSDALISNLEKNPELKSIIIEETPWLRDSKSEAEQKRRIGLLFDLNTMRSKSTLAKDKLKNNQLHNGAWPWFAGGRESRYITQHIIMGMGHLKHLKVDVEDYQMKQMTRNGLKYLDNEFLREYNKLINREPKADLNANHLTSLQLHYLYTRSFYDTTTDSKAMEKAINYYMQQIEEYWLDSSLYSKGLMSLIAHRSGKTQLAHKIVTSLKENSILSEEMGMYWKENTNSRYWYQANIETHALLIEAFAEIENDIQVIDHLKRWLIKHKQSNKWKTTKATTAAVYALLMQGNDWLSVYEDVSVTIGNAPIPPSKLEHIKKEAGTGYYKVSWTKDEISPEMSEITLSKKENGVAWGAVYWQYFEDLDKITSSNTALKIRKQLYLKEDSDHGKQLQLISPDTKIKVGDLVVVRIEIMNDRPMEFVHMKDMRASGLEPLTVLSEYKYQDGLGYYENTKDASTNFFFDYLPKGQFVFEYELRANNSGVMSNGITSIQSMYAPEFSSHSEGLYIQINK